MGQFTYWHDDGDGPLPEERPRVAAARADLLATLARAADQAPGDPWVTGQRVRYEIESGRPDGAVALARVCRADPWWCAALTGYALHAAGDAVAAESAYAVALDELPPETRCRWIDVGDVIDRAAARGLAELTCAERESLARRLWWLADPLWSRPGNDRRLEHLSRLTRTELERDAASPYGGRWGDDRRELMVRYGWPVAWARSGGLTDPEPQVTGFHALHGIHFVPDAAALANPTAAPAEAWRPDDERARERYSPSYAESFDTLAHVVAAFPRGDSTVVVAAFDSGPDSTCSGGGCSVSLVLARDEWTAPVAAAADGDSGSGVVTAVARWRPTVYSLELVAPGRRHLARARAGMGTLGDAAGLLALSAVLLFDPGDSLPQSLAGVLPLVLAPGGTPAGAHVGLYWELHAPAGRPVRFAVTVSRAPGGRLRRAVETVGLARRGTPIRLEWDETARRDAEPAFQRAVALDLSGLAPGRYRIALTARGGGSRVEVEGEVTVAATSCDPRRARCAAPSGRSPGLAR